MINLDKHTSIKALSKILEDILNSNDIEITAQEEIYRDSNGKQTKRYQEFTISTIKEY